LLALALTMKSLSIFSILGIIMLVGLVGKNAILLVDRRTRCEKKKISLPTRRCWRQAKPDSGRYHDAVAMVFGMLPIALSGAAGSEWKSGLAWALIGGSSAPSCSRSFSCPLCT